MKLLAVLSCALALAGCAKSEEFYRITIDEPIGPAPGFHEAATISLFALYTDGHCGEHYPLVEDQNIYTPACGMTESELRERLADVMPNANHSLSRTSYTEYAEAAERSERLEVD